MAGSITPGGGSINKTARRLAAGLLALFVLLLVYVTYLQIWAAEGIYGRPENRRALLLQAEQPRGAILTSDGQVLARSIPGRNAFVRVYPQGEMTAHITGYSSLRFGRSGLEARFERDLSSPVEGPLADRIVSLLKEQRSPGDLVLTLDFEVQRAATEALAGRRGAVVALDPRTGAVLALAGSPSYDPNPLVSGSSKEADAAWRSLLDRPDRPLLSRATQELYPPGSTFKVVTASAALESGIANPTTRFRDAGSLALPLTRHRIENFGGRVHGNLDFARAFAVSSNVVFAQIGLQLGARRLVAQAERLRINSAIPFELPLAESRIPSPAQLDEPSTAMSAIGQRDVRVTPLQMALIAATVANNGIIPRPHLVAEIRSGRDSRILGDTSGLGRAFSSETARTLTGLMEKVVREGSGRAAAIPGLRVAGKTGTAQTGSGPPHLWFVAFAPAGDPKVAVAVLVEGGAGTLSEESTGGRVAAPIARRVLAAALGDDNE